MANNTIITLDSIKKGAIRVYDGLAVVWPQAGNKVEYLSGIKELCSKFNGCYAANNSTVAVVSDNQMYVAPYTRTLMSALAQEGFYEDHFYVPFSNWDYPQREHYQWDALRKAAHQSYKEDFIADCEDYCDKHHIGTISAESLVNCFEMPEDGVRVKHLYFEDTYYPIMNQRCLDCRCENLGHFCYNNGRVVFVYRNGKTYVTKGYKIVSELEAAGYTKSGLFVPFSNGEEIQDYALRVRWESITK